jgi:hypothetical protein
VWTLEELKMVIKEFKETHDSAEEEDDFDRKTTPE